MIVIGKPPLGEQTHSVLVGKMKSGKVCIQTASGWIYLEQGDIEGVCAGVLMCVDPKQK